MATPTLPFSPVRAGPVVPPTRSRERGNLAAFMVSTAEPKTLPRLGAERTSSPTLRLTKLKSITSSITLDLCKERVLPPREQTDRYFLNNVITPSESQKVVQLLDGPQFRNSHQQQLTPQQLLQRKQQQHARSIASSVPSGRRFAVLSHDSDAEIRRFDEVHKHAAYHRLHRHLLSDIYNGSDDNSAVFLRATTRDSTHRLDEIAKDLGRVTLSSSAKALTSKLKTQRERTDSYRDTVRANTAEARIRNKEFIDETLRRHKKEKAMYGDCETEDDDLREDQEFLEKVQRSRTTSAAVLRQGFSLELFPFVIKEFLDSLHSDCTKTVTFSSSTALVDPRSSQRSSFIRTHSLTNSQSDFGDSILGDGDCYDDADAYGDAASGERESKGHSAKKTRESPDEEDGEDGDDGGEESVISLEDDNIASISLRNWGLADARAQCLAAALPSCPALRHLDISGNRLTDSSCAPILQALLEHCANLQYLNLSDNKLDEKSIRPLRGKLASHDCSIEALHLAKSDVDDEECCLFMESMRTNASVRTLNLSNNKIGEMEEHLLVFPSFVTGGMAIAEVFSSNSTLTELNLSWNQIRKDSALVLVKSFADNHTLRILSLSHNNIGDLSCQYLGHALRKNNTLTKLDLSYNNILPKGVLVLATALEGHVRMRDVALNGNCVGDVGSKALLRTMRLAATAKRKLKISFRDANVHFEDRALFNRHEPRQGNYSLQLEDPYQYMIAHCLYEAYNGKLGARFRSLQYRAPEGRSWDKIPLKRPDTGATSNAAWAPYMKAIATAIDSRIRPLEAKLKASGGLYSDQQSSPETTSEDASDESYELYRQVLQCRVDLQLAIIGLCQQLGLGLPKDVAQRIASILETLPPERRSQIHMVFHIVFRTVFRIVDCDKSYSVDQEELAQCLSLLGVSVAESPELCADYARRMIAGVDVDGSASLDEGEFIRMLFVTYTETYPESPLPLVDARNNTPWQVPPEGHLEIDFVSEKLPPSLDDLQSDDAVQSISTSLESTSDNGGESAIKSTVCDDMFITCEQAEVLLRHFRNPHVDAQVAARNGVECFLPQMTTTVEACRFLAQNLSLREIFKLRRKWGPLLSGITGLACGHYHLNLNDEMERKAAKRLAQLNSLSKSKASMENPTRDTSQTGDYESFRNSSHNFNPLPLTSCFFSDIPLLPVNKVRFDFVNVNRPVPGIDACGDEGIENMLQMVFASDLEEEQSELVMQEEEEDEDDPDVIAERALKAEEARLAEQIKKEKEEAQKSRRSGAGGLLAGLKKQEEMTRLAQAKFDAKQNRKVESLQAITEKSYDDACRIQWQSFLDSTRVIHQLAYLDAVQEAARAAAIDLGESQGGKAEPSPEVLASKIFRDARNRPYSFVNVHAFVERVRKAARRALRASRGGSKKHDHQPTNAVPSVPERELLVAQCMRFEKNLQMLESYLVYNMWLSAEQVVTLCQAFQKRGAPDAVLIRCICITFCRCVDLENLHPTLCRHFHSSEFQQELVHRLGILNLLSPVRPDGSYELDLAAFDEREACKLLVRLAVIESPEARAAAAIAAAAAAAAAAAVSDTVEIAIDKQPSAAAAADPKPHFVSPQYRRSVLEAWGKSEAPKVEGSDGDGKGAKSDKKAAGGKAGTWQVPTGWREADPAGPPKFGVFRFTFQATEEDEDDDAAAEDRSKATDMDSQHKASKRKKGKSKGKGKSKKNGGKKGGAKGGGKSKSTDAAEEGAEEEDGEGDDDGLDAASAPSGPLPFSPNWTARAELMAFRCLSGTKGTFVQGVTDPKEKAKDCSSQKSETGSLINEADWDYVLEGFDFGAQGERGVPAENAPPPSTTTTSTTTAAVHAVPYLDVVGHSAQYFGSAFASSSGGGGKVIL